MTGLTITSVGHTGITVANLDRSVAFYRDVLGFPVSERVQASGELFEKITGIIGVDLEVCFVRAPGLILELLCYRKPDGRVTSKLRGCDTGAFHVALKVKDIERVTAAIRSGGFESFSPPQTIPEGPLKGLKAVYARDPDGMVLELIEEPPGISVEEMFFSSGPK